MATIAFDYTWIAVGRHDYGVIDHYGEPMTVIGNWASFVGFNYDRIQELLENTEMPATVIFKFDTNGDASFSIALHSEKNKPDIQPYPGVIIGPHHSFTGSGTHSVDITTIEGTGYDTLLSAIGDGWYPVAAWPGDSADDLVGYSPKIEITGQWTPKQPEPTTPVGGILLDRTKDITFQWQHNGVFDQRFFEIRYKKTSESNWTSINQASSDSEYILSADTLDQAEYEWQVRTYFDTSVSTEPSPWSLSQVFTATNATNAPTITKPTNGETLKTASLRVEWEPVENQERYNILLIEDGQIVQFVDLASASHHVVLDGWLENNKSYILSLRVRAAGELWSDFAQINIDVSYTEPAKPQIIFSEDEEKSGIAVYIENPEPEGTQPNVIGQDLYRRRKGRSDWEMLARGLANNGVYIDLTLAGNTEYEYRVRVHGDNETSVNSDVFTASVRMRDALLSRAIQPTEMVRLRMSPERSFSTNFSATTKQFAGRKKPVTEFGELIETTSGQSYLVEHGSLAKLQDMLHKQETLLYRDGRGRKQFVTVESLEVTDDRLIDHYAVSMSMTEMDYTEGVGDD